MFERSLSTELPEEVARYLVNAWVTKFATEELGITQYSNLPTNADGDVTFGDPTKDHFKVAETGLLLRVTDFRGYDAAAVEDIVNRAADRVAHEDFGEGVVYICELRAEKFDFFGAGSVQFSRLLGDQALIDGWRRLNDMVLLHFVPEPTDGSLQLFVPETTITATMFVPGPTSSQLSNDFARRLVEVVAAVCALATGKCVNYPRLTFSAEPDMADRAREQRCDSSILGLARDSISLDIFGELQHLGGEDSYARVTGALLAYHAALRQDNPDVAVMLFVSAIEALLSPRQSWGRHTITQRFIKAVGQLCPEAVDEVLDHSSTAACFQFQPRGKRPRQRRELLSKIYEARSIPTHQGLSFTPGHFSIDSTKGMTVALLSDLSRAAILNYIKAPRSSIVGCYGEGHKEAPNP